MLAGKEIRIHTALVCLAIADGLALFGVSGLMRGPVVLATAVGLVEVLSRDRQNTSTSLKNSCTECLISHTDDPDLAM